MKMDNLMILTVVLFACNELGEGESSNAEIVYPEKIYGDRVEKDIESDTKENNGYGKDSLNLRIKSKNEGDLVIHLKKDIPVQENVMVRAYTKTGTPLHKFFDHPDCMYSGFVEGKRESNAYFSMCDETIKGSLDTGTKMYQIEPHDDSGAHKLYNVDDEIGDIADRFKGEFTGLKDVIETTEQDTRWDETQNRKTSSVATGKIYTKLNSSLQNTLEPMELINIENKYLPYLAVNHTRYIECFVSVGHQLTSHYENDIAAIIKAVMTLMGNVDQSFSAIGIRVVVVAIEIQNNGPTFERMSEGSQDLKNFRTYFNKIRNDGKLKDISLDVGIFLSKTQWGNKLGLTYRNGMCHSINGVTMNKFNERKLLTSTMVIGHEFGHNLNMQHTWDERKKENCTCLTEKGCFMGGSYTGRLGFTDCGVRRMDRSGFSCLNNYPKNSLVTRCGNGIKEGDEECDCGTEENCARNDPCCEPLGCRLKAASQCSMFDTECCDNNCQFKRQGTMCRESASNCDVPEYCSGDSAMCPADRLIADGTGCGENKKLILGTHWRKVMRRQLSPTIVGRYFKIILKHWNKPGKPVCMRLELIGCPPQEGFSSNPTSMVTPNLYYIGEGEMCLGPDVSSCEEVVDGTKLLYLKNIEGLCKQPHMKFVHNSDGILRHHCTGKKICVGKESTLLIISGDCADADSKFTRTEEKAFKNIKTGKCIHAPAGRGPDPNKKDNARLHLESWCKRRSAKLILPEIDCVIPLGLEDQSIPDSALSSAPTTDDTDITDVRMGSGRNVCFDTKGKAGWVQVDVGKLTVLSAIDIGGSNWYYVTGFHLMYSDNGISWKYYKETDNGSSKGLDSVCYSGSCTPTLDHQCRSLWGADSRSASQQCYNELNTKADGYGTCSPTEVITCQESNVRCGQIQCVSATSRPFYNNYGREYKDILINGTKCSAAKMSRENDEVGEGMVADGTVCGNDKMCLDQVCKTVTPSCGIVSGKMCGGNGFCMDNGKCHCNSGYNPDDNCATELAARNGGWSNWSLWTQCPECGTTSADSAIRRRHRFCDNPSAKHGGTTCRGDRIQKEQCICEEGGMLVP